MTPPRLVPRLWPALLFLAVAPLGAQTPPPPSIAPGGNLIADGVPPIPTEIAEKASRYGESRGAIFADWHPTNGSMLILTRFGDTNQVHLVKAPGGDRKQLTFFPDRVEGAKFEPTKGEYFVFHKGAGGAEFFQNYRYDMATGDITLITDGKGRNSEPTFSRDGKLVAYTSTRRDGTDTDLYTEDPLDPKTDHLLAQVQGGGWEVQDWSPDGKKLLVLEEVSVSESHLWLFDAQSGERAELTPRGGATVAYTKARFAKDGQSCYVISDLGGEFRQLAALDFATKKTRQLTPNSIGSPNAGDVEDFDLSPDGAVIAYVVNDKGGSTLYSLEVSHAPTTGRAGVGWQNVVSGLHWKPDGKSLAYTLAAEGIPADVLSISAEQLRLYRSMHGSGFNLSDYDDPANSPRWTESETGGIPPTAFVTSKLVEWKSFDGKEISGFLYAPDEKKFPGQRPVIVNIHGGPESQYRPVFLGRNNYFINELGCAMIYPNVRGSSGYGKTFVNLDNGFLREDSYKDIGALLDWVKTQPALDAGRIMVTGGSYGGHMTLAVSTQYADKIRCSVDVVGMSNLRTFLEHTESYRRDLRRVEYGDERLPRMAEFLDRIAPMNNAAKITKPMFVVQGYNDPRVPRSEAEQMVATLKKQGTPVWSLTARDEGHGFAKKKNADFQFYATVEFIRQYLLGGG